MHRLSGILFLFILLSLSTCKEDAKYEVNSELNPYLQRFLNEGAKRGRAFDLKEDGLVMEFADLESPTIGLCYYTLPIRVQIDRSYWEETKESANMENLREDVVFHELAHGLLDRRHKNATLPDTEWASLMCGGDEVDSRSWAVNFNGYRKQYYLDELFNPGTSTPDWGSEAVFDGDKGTLLKNQDYLFSDNIDSYQKNGLVHEISDGVYKISSFSAKNNLLSFFSGFEAGEDFYWEMSVSSSFSGDEAFTGLFAGYYTDTDVQEYNYFTVNSVNRSQVCNTKCILPFAEVLLEDKFNSNEKNLLALSKRGEELFFYINNKLVYRNDYPLDGYNVFGLIIPAGGNIAVHNYALYGSTEGSLKTTSVIKDNHVYELPMFKIEKIKK